jgi:nicotinate-nucleotide adenylyltransferase
MATTFWKRKRTRPYSEPETVIRSRIAIFGGTFDPIHKAHLTVAREAITQHGLSTVLFVVAANPPHKKGTLMASFEDRYRMVELACRGESGFMPSRLEEDTEISYSLHTIEKVKAVAGPEAMVYFLIGADAFADIRTWHRWTDVIREAAFIVVTRPGHNYEIPPGSTIQRLSTLAMPVSSSDIRARLAEGLESPDLPPAVMDYIRSRGLYGFPRPRP